MFYVSLSHFKAFIIFYLLQRILGGFVSKAYLCFSSLNKISGQFVFGVLPWPFKNSISFFWATMNRICSSAQVSVMLSYCEVHFQLNFSFWQIALFFWSILWYTVEFAWLQLRIKCQAKKYISSTTMFLAVLYSLCQEHNAVKFLIYIKLISSSFDLFFWPDPCFYAAKVFFCTLKDKSI